MALLAHQKITWVLPGQPFGRGTLGAYSSATAPTMTKDSCSGTATSTTLTTTSATFANGDLIKIIQMRGTGVGLNEFALVVSGGGTNTLTLSKALVNTYTDSGASQAQAIKVNEYTDVTAQAGTWTGPTWDTNVGGDLIIASKGTFTPTATLTISGSTGNTAAVLSGNSAVTTGGGFTGGYGQQVNGAGSGRQGEGSAGAGGASNAANGTGGGAGLGSGGAGSSGGAGGGHATGGANGGSPELTNGTGGGTTGDTNLQGIHMGGAGGGSFSKDGVTQTVASGGSGGGIIEIYAKIMTAPTNIFSKGGNSGDGSRYSDSGAGAGGSILICAGTVNIGTDKLSVVGGSAVGYGGAGGKGRIAVYYGTSLTGSISASLYGSYTNALDTDLVEISDVCSPLFFRGGFTIG